MGIGIQPPRATPTRAGTFGSIALLAGTQALGILLTPGPKRAYFDEIFSNQASEIKPYAYLAGTNRIVPDLTWYGDLATDNVRNGDAIENMLLYAGLDGLAGYIAGGGTFGFGIDPPTALQGLVVGAAAGAIVGGLGAIRTASFKYFAGFAYTIGHGRIDGVTEVLEDETVLATGSSVNAGGTITINKPNQWGGPHVEGGRVAICDIVAGDLWPIQLPSPYLVSRIGPVPAFSGKALFIMRGPGDGTTIDGELTGLFAGAPGGAPRVRPLSLTVLRLPDLLGVPEFKAINDGKDANVVEVIFDVMTGRVRNYGYGGRVPVEKFDFDSFRAAAETVYNEGLGYSAKITDNISTLAFLEDLCSFASAAVFETRAGEIKIRLIRRDYSIPSLKVFNETNVERVTGYTPETYGANPNEIRLEYPDRDHNYKPRNVIAQNDASRRLLQETISRSLNFPGVGCSQTAAIVCARELAASFPRAPLQLLANTDGDDVEYGDPIVWQSTKHRVAQKILRVVGIKPSDTQSNKVLLTCAEDVFGRGDVITALPAGTLWTPTAFSFDVTRYNLPALQYGGTGDVDGSHGEAAYNLPMLACSSGGSASVEASGGPFVLPMIALSGSGSVSVEGGGNFGIP